MAGAISLSTFLIYSIILIKCNLHFGDKFHERSGIYIRRMDDGDEEDDDEVALVVMLGFLGG